MVTKSNEIEFSLNKTELLSDETKLPLDGGRIEVRRKLNKRPIVTSNGCPTAMLNGRRK
jgi:hypothetical protein